MNGSCSLMSGDHSIVGSYSIMGDDEGWEGVSSKEDDGVS